MARPKHGLRCEDMIYSTTQKTCSRWARWWVADGIIPYHVCSMHAKGWLGAPTYPVVTGVPQTDYNLSLKAG